jgi:P4 family phage/plasmid primase-like protien
MPTNVREDTPADHPSESSHNLSDKHEKELVTESAIDPAVVAERGYRTIYSKDDLTCRYPGWATRDESAYPGWEAPIFRATGEVVSGQFKPAIEQEGPKGRPVKYASQAGQPNHIDVHPRWKSAIRDLAVELWITEGLKKADSLTSRGVLCISLTGVFNWRSKLGTLGDWEDVPLKGRTVTVCFDADARTKPEVLRAMLRLGRWLKSKGAKVLYLIVPAKVNGVAVKGVDNYFAAEGTLEALLAARTDKEPEEGNRDTAFTDARMAETIADEVLDGRYCWTSGLGWLHWDGKRWAECSEEKVTEAVRRYVVGQYEAVAKQASMGDKALLDGWYSLHSKARIGSVLALARGMVEEDAADFDADPDILNVGNGVVDLRTGVLLEHDPARLITKLAPVDYVPEATHPDWTATLEALPEDVREWVRLRYGQAVTGHMTPDDRLIVGQGGGENGKSTIMAAIPKVLGSYYLLVSHRALLANPDAHPTELMDFRGVRFALLEETPEERQLSVTRLKTLVGTPQITARKIRQDSVTFDATHSLFLSTNYKPVVKETDHGTWRRLALLTFPYRFRKPGEALEGPNDEVGDPGLRDRLKFGEDGQHEAILAWLVAGAQAWYAAGKVMPPLPERVEADTQAWRADSDLIVGYIGERLMFDADRHISSRELLDDFNEWLGHRGHRPWSDSTLASRFGGHDEITAHRVEKRQTRKGQKGTTASRRPDITSMTSLPARYAAWTGVRFRTVFTHR